MPVAKRETCDGRVIAHVDMDCFYVQVEQRKQPNLRGLPTAVIQYNSYKGGALIAVSYEARRCGVKRSMRGDEAKEACPQIQLVQVPVARGKADLNSYRSAGSEVVSVLSQKGRCERASIDEVYIDLTHAAEAMLMETPPESMQDFEEEVLKSHVLGLEIQDGSDAKDEVRKWLCRSDASYQDKLLACGALIVNDLRMQVLKETEFTCSAGIAHNKMLAKLASAMNKPAQQTIVPHSSVEGLLASLPIKKMKHLGGKLGSSVQIDLGVNTVGDLLQFSEEKLQQLYGINTGTWLWNIARGISGEEVEGRLLPKSHGSGKTFPGPQALKTIDSVQRWLNELCEELNERLHSDLDLNKRIAQTLTLHARAYKTGDSDSHRKFPSKSCPLRYGTRKIQEDAIILFQAGLRDFLGFCSKAHGSENNYWGVTSLSVSASKIVSIPSGTHSIVKYFGGQFPSSSTSNQSQDVVIDGAAPSGSENCSGLVPYESQLEYPEDTGMKHSKSSLYQQDPLCNLSSKADSLTEESLLMSPLGSEDRMIHDESRRDLPAKDHRLVSNISGLKAVGKKKRAGKQLQGNSSITNFFSNYHNSQSSSEQKNVTNAEGVKISSSHGSQSADDSYSTPNRVGQPAEHPHEEIDANKSGCSVGNIPQGRRQAWSYNIDEIDPSIIDELPPEIQQEFRTWLRPHKRSNVVKRGSSITHYFLPDKSR
ncbi:DNA polymerase eta [Cajanus cajan]|uniref:DNA polymerase eta n=1 Tax=Cajanus cajan TaxID=3821 RepID=A0A151S638_CAJCA|nr:DNA polymerase eta [Cajanus cajan]XP_029130107.1 DNA polymerase eta [Cajanus cajan]KYP50285.1 DNA polymerase eta [Cajanus cajan]